MKKVKFVDFSLGSRKLFLEEYPIMLSTVDLMIRSIYKHGMEGSKFHLSIIETKDRLEKEQAILIAKVLGHE